MPSGEALALFERLQDERFLLCAHAAQRGSGRRLPRVGIVERPDAGLAIQGRHRLGADALQAQEVENGRRKLGDQLAMVVGVAGLADLADAAGEILADAGNFAQAGFVERRQVVRMVRDDVGAVPVRTNLERVVVLDLEEIGDLPQDSGDR